MRFHVVALPHTQVTKEYVGCAFTMKILKFCQMMHGLGHEVYLYAGEDNEAPVTEHVTIISKDEQREWYGPDGGYTPQGLPIIDWASTAPPFATMNIRAGEAIEKRCMPGDYLCLIAGHANQPIDDYLHKEGLYTVEYGIGYSGVFAKYRVFESYAWMHYLAKNELNDDLRYFDTVIPNYWDPADFPMSAFKPGGVQPYLFWIGRGTMHKGPHIAAAIAKATGLPLYLAGSGVLDKQDGKYVQFSDCLIEGDVHHIGPVNTEERAHWMGTAVATLVPTINIEPFGGVAIESQLCGTPAITSDWGAFTETIPSRQRFRTLKQGVEAVERVRHWTRGRRSFTRDMAISKYSLDAVAPQYETYFESLRAAGEGAGWYSV